MSYTHRPKMGLWAFTRTAAQALGPHVSCAHVFNGDRARTEPCQERAPVEKSHFRPGNVQHDQFWARGCE